MKADQTKKGQPNCNLCRHFFITYEPAHPYGCRAMGFKASRQPCETVFASSGMPCQMFEARIAKKQP
jgi:hypothetical protein